MKQSRWMLLTRGIVISLLATSAAVHAQDQVSYAQQIYLMKQMKPSLQEVAVLSITMSDSDVEALTRAGMGQQVKVVIGRAKNVSEIAGLYKKILKDYKVEFIWLPDANDTWMVEAGFEYLKQQAPLDNLGIIVPTKAMVDGGGLACFTKNGKDVQVYMNKRMAGFLKLTAAVAENSGITIVMN